MESAREWVARASVAMFQVQHCTCCDNYTPALTGIFQRQASRFNKGAVRWVTATEDDNYGLVKEVKTTESDVPFCAQCLGEWGFPADQLGIVFDNEPAEEPEQSLEELFEAEFAAMQMELPFDAPTAAPAAIAEPLATSLPDDWDSKDDSLESREAARQRRVHAIACPDYSEEPAE